MRSRYCRRRDNDRPEYGKILAAVRRRDVDVVLVWRYDRFARSTHAIINALTEFHALGVDFISLQEGTDTTTAQGKLVFTIMAGLAEFESALISERVTAGMERARAEGKHVGRPPVDSKTIEQMQEFRRQGRSYSDIQKASTMMPMNCGYGTLSADDSGAAQAVD